MRLKKTDSWRAWGEIGVSLSWFLLRAAVKLFEVDAYENSPAEDPRACSNGTDRSFSTSDSEDAVSRVIKYT